jgi:hypothetical protein
MTRSTNLLLYDCGSCGAILALHEGNLGGYPGPGSRISSALFSLTAVLSPPNPSRERVDGLRQELGKCAKQFSHHASASFGILALRRASSSYTILRCRASFRLEHEGSLAAPYEEVH